MATPSACWNRRSDRSHLKQRRRISHVHAVLVWSGSALGHYGGWRVASDGAALGEYGLPAMRWAPDVEDRITAGVGHLVDQVR